MCTRRGSGWSPLWRPCSGKESLVERCRQCVMPGGVAAIGQDGVCSFCAHDPGLLEYKGEDSLREILERHKARSRREGRRYDCLLRTSGGKDSLGALLRLVKDYDMKVLAFTYESSFTHPQATENVRVAVERLGIDLVVNRNDRVQKRYVRHNLLAFAGQEPDRLPGLSHLLCVGCVEGTRYAAARCARKHGIKLVVSGGCPIEVDLQNYDRSPGSAVGLADHTTQAWRLRRLRVSRLPFLPMLWDPRYPKNVLRYLKLPNPLSYVGSALDGMEYVALHTYVEWNEVELLDKLRGALGWRNPEGRTSTKRFDCKIHQLLDGIRRKHMGLSEKEAELSAMIRRGMLSRDAALGAWRSSSRRRSACCPQRWRT